MDSILSASEIEALFKATDAADVAKAIKTIDLVAREHQAFALLPKLQEAADRLALQVSRICTQQLRTACKGSADAVEVIPGSRLPDLLEGARFVSGVRVGSVPGSGVVAIDGLLGGAYVERQFGGEPDLQRSQDGNPTVTERRTVARLARRVLGALQQALDRVSPFEAEVEAEAPDLLKNSGSRAVAMVLFIVRLTIGEHRSRVAIAIDTAAAGFKVAEPELERTDAPRGVLLPELLRARINVSALLGTVPIRVSRLIALKPGDVITLETPVDAEIPLFVEGKPKFLGTPTIARGSLGLQISQPIKE